MTIIWFIIYKTDIEKQFLLSEQRFVKYLISIMKISFTFIFYFLIRKKIKELYFSKLVFCYGMSKKLCIYIFLSIEFVLAKQT